MENDVEEKDVEEKIHLPLGICNVCAIANLRCHLNLSHIAQNGIDVEYDNFLNVLKTKLRKPKVGLAQFWSNGKMSVFGCDDIDNARKGCRILARRIKKLGYDAKFDNFQIVNILTKIQLPFKIRIHEMAGCDNLKFLYEPELDPNLYYYPNPKNRGRKFNEYKTMAKLTTNGKVTIHSSSLEEAGKISQQVYRLSLPYVIEEIVVPEPVAVPKIVAAKEAATDVKVVSYDQEDDEDEVDDDEEEDEDENVVLPVDMDDDEYVNRLRPRKRVVVQTYSEELDNENGNSSRDSVDIKVVKAVTAKWSRHNNDARVPSSSSSVPRLQPSLNGSKKTTVHFSYSHQQQSQQATSWKEPYQSIQSPAQLHQQDSIIDYPLNLNSGPQNALTLLETQHILDDLLN